MPSSRLIEASCPVCASAHSRPVTVVKDYLLRVTDDTFGVRRCCRCGCGFLSPRPAPEEIGKFYPRQFYWSFEHATAPLTANEVLAQRRDQLANKLSRIAHLRKGRLLDIGAMKGEFLHIAAKEGWQAEGVEFSEVVPNLFD